MPERTHPVIEVDRACADLQSVSADMVLVDFDHTLFGSNSTERYLASARPAFLASFLLFVIRGLVPWRRLPGHHWYRVRDYLAVFVVTLLMPWNLLRWWRSAPLLFERHGSRELLQILSTRAAGQVVIVSFGFDTLIAPLLRQTSLRDCRRICVPFLATPARLRKSKLAVLEKAIGRTQIGQAAFVTDSLDDKDVLDEVAHPFLIRPIGNAMTAERQLYLPLRYTAIAKYDPRFVRSQVFFIELVIVLLALLPAILLNWLMAPAAICLFLSIYAIYEIGYFENDQVAARNEAAPVVTAEAATYAGFRLERQAWVWASLLGLAGCALPVLAGSPAMPWRMLTIEIAVWLAVLLVTRGIFYFYNRRPPERRMLVYPGLQATKLFGTFAILQPCRFGIALAFGQLVMMWMNYAIYRAGGDKSAFPREGVRLIVFVLLACGLVAASRGDFPLVEALAGGAMLAWAAGRLAISKLSNRRRARSPA